MRALLMLSLLAGACGPGSDGTCEVDDDCGGSVCARTGECLSASSLQSVRVTWTVRGQMANATSCAPSPSLYILFGGFDPGDTLGFEPVPCDAGLFFIDKLPARFQSVELGERGGFALEMSILAGQTVAFDLMP